jgi:signal transduction histidine kinase
VTTTLARGGVSAALVLAALVLALDGHSGSPLRHAVTIPVVVAGLSFGPAGGVLAATAAASLAVPRVLAQVEGQGFPDGVLEDGASCLVWLTLGPLVGALAGAARRQRLRYETLQALQQIAAEAAPLPEALARLRGCLISRLAAFEIVLVVRDGAGLVRAGPENDRLAPAIAAVLSAGRAAHLPDSRDLPRPCRAVIAPLVAAGGVIGALAVERLGEIGRREAQSIVTLGIHLGLALENARLLACQRRFAEELREQVAAAARTHSGFVAVASHELRTPLTALRGFAELLAYRRFAPEEVRRVAIILTRETERLTRMVDDLLDLSRLERGEAPRLARAPVHPVEAIEAAVELFRAAAPRHRLVVDCAPALPPMDVDPDALARILRNLLGNAVKYAPAGGVIAVRARPHETAVEILIEDEGPGIAPEAVPRLFEPYYRAPEAAARAPGTGLGLAVVKGLVEAHGGRVGVDSALGRGTRVWFTLPVASLTLRVGAG